MALHYPSRIFLTGPMASGKSTVGPLLADALGTRFVDLDWLVEARTGMRVPELFAQRGEAAFRVAEAGALDEATRGTPAVIATGGGTLAVARNLHAARAAGAIVWLRVPVEMLAERLAETDLAARPLLTDGAGGALSPGALRNRLADLVEAREPFYAQADVVVDASGSPEGIARLVADALRGWRRGVV